MTLCQACGEPTAPDQILCQDCSMTIDRATDRMLEEQHYDLGPDD